MFPCPECYWPMTIIVDVWDETVGMTEVLLCCGNKQQHTDMVNILASSYIDNFEGGSFIGIDYTLQFGVKDDNEEK